MAALPDFDARRLRAADQPGVICGWPLPLQMAIVARVRDACQSEPHLPTASFSGDSR
jgi:hypothetical protein